MKEYIIGIYYIYLWFSYMQQNGDNLMTTETSRSTFHLCSKK